MCANPRLIEIDSMVGGLGRVAAAFGISASSLGRHRRHAARSGEAALAERWAHVAPGRVAVEGPVTARAAAVEALEALRGELRVAAPEDVARIANALTHVLKFLARFDRAFDLTPARLMRSPAIREAMDRTERVLVAYPDAAKALRVALDEFCR